MNARRKDLSSLQKSLLLPRAIRAAREKRGWTQAELARSLEVSQTTVSFWETGAEVPSLENQVKLVTLVPDIFQLLAEQEAGLLARLYQLERALYGDSCSCERRRTSASRGTGQENPVKTHHEEGQ